LWAGLAVDNTAETTATGYLYSEQAGKIAVLVKSTRNALIGFRGTGFRSLPGCARSGRPHRTWAAGAGVVHLGENPQVRPGFPGGVDARDIRLVEQGPSANIANVSKWAFLLTFAGVG
jgi:Conserved hypothetical protein 698